MVSACFGGVLRDVRLGKIARKRQHGRKWRSLSALRNSSLRSRLRGRRAFLIGSRHGIEDDRDLQRPAEGTGTRASAHSRPPFPNNSVEDGAVAPPMEAPGVP